MGGSDTELPAPWMFLGDGSIFCSNEATPDGLLDDRWSPGRPSQLRSLELSAPGTREGLEIEVIITLAYLMKPP